MSSLKDILAKQKAKGKETKSELDPFANLKSKTQSINIDNTEPILAKTTKQKDDNEKLTFSPKEGIKIENISDDNNKKEAPIIKEKTFEEEFNYYTQLENVDKTVIEKLVNSLEILFNNMTDKEIISDAIIKTMNLIEEHPFLAPILRPKEHGLMVRALRESYGTTIAKKDKRSNKKKESSEAVKKIGQDLAGFHIDI